MGRHYGGNGAGAGAARLRLNETYSSGSTRPRSP